MASTRRNVLIWRRTCVVSLLVATGLQCAVAADNAVEREQLAALVRQLELVDRLSEQAATIAPLDRARYHFDYARLREDVKRVRAGVQDYLAPQRAQPRDPVVKRHKVDREIDLKSSHRQIRERAILKNRFLSTRCRIIDVKSSHLAGRPTPSMTTFCCDFAEISELSATRQFQQGA